MKKDHHGLYVLKIEDTTFYAGYSDRSLDQRLKEHVYNALNPNSKEKINRAIRGNKPSDKDQMIITAQQEGWSITIEKMLEVPVYEPVDEDRFINDLKNDGHFLTNVAKGSIFQKYVMAGDELVVTADNQSTVNVRESIQNWKRRSKDRTVADKVNKPSKTKSKKQIEEAAAIERLKRITSPEEHQAYMESFGFNFSNHKLTDWHVNHHAKLTRESGESTLKSCHPGIV